tara:strand:+ start:247 stop:438 length:192 start_codon:yes stop_codon:yes gene_type:complete
VVPIKRKFSASTFNEIPQLIQAHGKEKLQINYLSQINAMNDMSKQMQNTDSMNQWIEAKKTKV